MSTIKNILAVITDASLSRATMQTALDVGGYLKCHVDALHVRPDPVAALPLVGEAMSGAMVDEMIVVAEREADIRAKAAREMFDSLSGQSPEAAASWIEDTGIEEQVVAVRACRADLILLGRPIRENETAALMTLNAALMQSGRPVLVAPPPLTARPIAFGRIVVFWNGSTEATRAVTAALPFLVNAAQVTVLRVEEEEWFAPTDDLEAFLGHHGVRTVVSKVLPRQGRTGTALLTAAAESGADMMVMGAYTRSKLRQLILGSVTGYVMQNATLPVLLCH
jgi:nucleotide-binding universal stress UspA family protein